MIGKRAFELFIFSMHHPFWKIDILVTIIFFSISYSKYKIMTIIIIKVEMLGVEIVYLVSSVS